MAPSSRPARASGCARHRRPARATGSKGATEAVVSLSAARDARAALREDLPASAGELSGRAVQHADRAGVTGAADVLQRGAGGEIGEAVVVEVPGRQRLPELIERLGCAADLDEELPAGAGELGGRAVQHADRPGIG